MTVQVAREEIAPLAALGVVAFTTTREAGSFGTAGTEPVGAVMGRWWELVAQLSQLGSRFATARQVHGSRVVVHQSGWEGWLRVDAADGHVAAVPGTALAVTVADCVPIFLAHPAGAIALLHAGWRGTAARILHAGVAALGRAGCAPADLEVHLGPAICGRCYEVGPDVYAALTGRTVEGPRAVDLRGVLAGQARALGITRLTVSGRCTRCDGDRFFSHRGGDSGRQLAVMLRPGPSP